MAGETLNHFPCTRHGKRRCTACAVIDASDRTTAAIEAESARAAAAEQARVAAAADAAEAERKRVEYDRMFAADRAESAREREEAWARMDARKAAQAAHEEKIEDYAVAEAERQVRRSAYIDGRIAGHGPDDTYVDSYYRNVYGSEFDRENPKIEESLGEKARRWAAEMEDQGGSVGQGTSVARPTHHEFTPAEVAEYEIAIAKQKKRGDLDISEKVGGAAFVLSILIAVAFFFLTDASTFFAILGAIGIVVVGGIAAVILGLAADAFVTIRERRRQ